MQRERFRIRRATVDDAADVARVLNGVVAERRFTALDTPVTRESEAAFIASLGSRAAMFVAEVDGVIQGFQTLEPFASFTRSMDHVGIAGTQVSEGYRGQGAGPALWNATLRFAGDYGYEKVVVYVRRHNERALRFYRRLGFQDIGVTRRQVRIDGVYEDEVFLECFLDPGIAGREALLKP